MIMSIDATHTIDEDIKTVTEAFLAGRRVPADVEARLDEHAVEYRQRLIKQNGLLDLAVPFIRQDRETGH